MSESYDKISAVLFDVDGTLYSQKALRKMMVMRIARSLLIGRTSPKQLRIIACYRKQLEKLRINVPGGCQDLQGWHIESVAEITNCPVLYVDATVRQWMLKEPLPYLCRCLANGVETTLTRLRQANFKLGVLSDYPAKEKLAEMGLLDYFDEVISCQDKESSGYKPHTNGFQRLAQNLGVTSRSCIYVGDRFEIDVAGALESGMQAVWLTSSAKTRVMPQNCRHITKFADLERLLL